MTFLIAVIIALATPTPSPYRDGPTIYAQECLSCHGDQGQGSEGVPNLSGNGGVTANNPKPVIAIVKHGRGGMPAFGQKLSDVEIAAIVSYIRTAWGNEGTSVGVYQVDAVHRK
jgi:mono/diheme cytochrome c family protein